MLSQLTETQFNRVTLPKLKLGDYDILDTYNQISLQEKLLEDVTSPDVRVTELLVPACYARLFILKKLVANHKLINDHIPVFETLINDTHMNIIDQQDHQVMSSVEYFNALRDITKVDQSKTLADFTSRFDQLMTELNSWSPVIVFTNIRTSEVSVLVKLRQDMTRSTEYNGWSYQHTLFTKRSDSNDHYEQMLNVQEIVDQYVHQSVKRPSAKSKMTSLVTTNTVILDHLFNQLIDQRTVSSSYDRGDECYHGLSSFYDFYPYNDQQSTQLKYLVMNLVQVRDHTLNTAQLSPENSLIVGRVLSDLCENQLSDNAYLGSKFKYSYQSVSPDEHHRSEQMLIPLFNPRFTRQLAAADFAASIDMIDDPSDNVSLASASDVKDLIDEIKTDNLKLSLSAIKLFDPQQLITQFNRHNRYDSRITETGMMLLSADTNRLVSVRDNAVKILQPYAVLIENQYNDSSDTEYAQIFCYAPENRYQTILDTLAENGIYAQAFSTKSFNGYLRIYLTVSYHKINRFFVPTDIDSDCLDTIELPAPLKVLAVSDNHSVSSFNGNKADGSIQQVYSLTTSSLSSGFATDIIDQLNQSYYSRQYELQNYDGERYNESDTDCILMKLRVLPQGALNVIAGEKQKIMPAQADIINKLLLVTDGGRQYLENIR